MFLFCPDWLVYSWPDEAFPTVGRGEGDRGDGVGGEVRAGGGLDCLLLGMGGG